MKNIYILIFFIMTYYTATRHFTPKFTQDQPTFNTVEQVLLNWTMETDRTHVKNLTYINHDDLFFIFETVEQLPNGEMEKSYHNYVLRYYYELQQWKIFYKPILSETVASLDEMLNNVAEMINDRLMVDNSTMTISESLYLALETIEQGFEDYDFENGKVISESDTSNEIEINGSLLNSEELNKLALEFESFDDDMNGSTCIKLNEDDENNSNDPNDEDDDEDETKQFQIFANRLKTQDKTTNINTRTNINKSCIDFLELRMKAIEKINNSANLQNNSNRLFNPINCVSIVVNELKRLEEIQTLKLTCVNDDIYKIQLQINSVIPNTELIMAIDIDHIEYPIVPPCINIIKPKFTTNINLLINSMEYFKLDNWNSTNSLFDIVTKLCNIIEIKYANSELELDLTDSSESYSELNYGLTKLMIVSGMNQSNDDETKQFQIPFVKISDDSSNLTQNKLKYKYGNNGVGYGSGGHTNSTQWDIQTYLQSNKYKIHKMTLILTNIFTILSNVDTNDENQKTNLLNDISTSCLMKYLMFSLINDLDLDNFTTNIEFMNVLINITQLLHNRYIQLFDPYIEQITIKNKHLILANSITSNSDITKLTDLFTEIINAYQHKQESQTVMTEDLKLQYCQIMKQYQFDSVEHLEISYTPQSRNTARSRLGKEIMILSESLPMNYESSIYVRVDESNMQNIHALIIPSQHTPYSNGCFLFHIYLDAKYPEVPPHVTLQTTGKGVVRFNPNLYANGKVCLSLLGTWSGTESESWNPVTSTILQVLISIQSLIFIEDPYFNEPGYQSSINTEIGKTESLRYNKQLYEPTMKYAMIEMITNPPTGFENVILNHFRLKKQCIIEEVNLWAKYDDSVLFKKTYSRLVDLLNKL